MIFAHVVRSGIVHCTNIVIIMHACCSFPPLLSPCNSLLHVPLLFSLLLLLLVFPFVSLSVCLLNSADYHFIILIPSDKNERNTTKTAYMKCIIASCCVCVCFSSGPCFGNQRKKNSNQQTNKQTVQQHANPDLERI